jgi:micrococcal nuclease
VYQYAARLIRVIDADTVVLDLDLGFYQWRLNRSYRLVRINAPEMSTPDGVLAKAALVEHLAGVTIFLVQTARADSFDRWIVELYADGQNVSDWLVASGFAQYQVYR